MRALLQSVDSPHEVPDFEITAGIIYQPTTGIITFIHIRLTI